MVEPEPEIWVPVPQPYFVGQASLQKIQWFSGFNGPNHSGPRDGAKIF